MQDRPTALELLEAVRQFLNQEIVPTLSDHRQKFRTLIAANVLSIVERELASQEDDLREEWRRLVVLEGGLTEQLKPPDSLAALRREIDARKRVLCARIRAGETDAGPWRREVFDYLFWAVEEKLRVSNPRYLQRMPGL